MPSDKDYLLVLLGAIGFIVLSHQFPSLRQLKASGCTSCANKLENINGIDQESLRTLRQKGLM